MSDSDVRRVLVLGVGGVVGQGIIEALRLAKTRYWIEAACVSAEAPGHLLADGSQLSPYAADEDFPEWLEGACDRLSIDIVLSGQEDVLEALAERSEDPLAGGGTVYGVDAAERLRLTRDKLRMDEWLVREGFPTPATVACADQERVRAFLDLHPAPWVVKPRFGHGARGMLTTHDPELVLRLAGADEMLLQAHLASDRHEQTVACLFDPVGGLVGSESPAPATSSSAPAPTAPCGSWTSTCASPAPPGSAPRPGSTTSPPPSIIGWATPTPSACAIPRTESRSAT